jgi:amino acid permease
MLVWPQTCSCFLPVSHFEFNPNCIVFVIVKYCFQNQIDKPELHADLNIFTPSALPLFFGIAVFDFEGNGVIINLQQSMKEPEKFEYVLHRVLSLYVILIASFSAIAYYVSLFDFQMCLVLWRRTRRHGHT